MTPRKSLNTMPRIKIIVAYVGTRYNGWQIQTNGTSIQEELERCIARVNSARVRVHGSGRTDAGVHATAQTAHFDVSESKAPIPWTRALNSMLPKDIRVLHHRVTDTKFHARFSATGKRYTYTFWTDPRFVLPQRLPFVWAIRSPDPAAMDRAASFLIGTHDFASFQNAGTPVADTVRTIRSITRGPGAHPGEWVYTFEANGFLKQMVRNLAGLLHAAGQGKISPAAVPDILAAADRRAAPFTAPPQGLSMDRVFYPEEYDDHGLVFGSVP
ncbi:MAG TPA: tRNA pseudouridine(38-40) synthase TruA [Desulfomicrobiaceae bacterium]|nr:tRNA pseudouridine(38-40) synthase TruA [Desulfomicrobiaceae bacterium]